MAGNHFFLGKMDRSLGHSEITKLSREERFWRERELRHSRFQNCPRSREVRVVGRRLEWRSSEKEVAYGNIPLIERILREGSPVSPHWYRGY